MRGSSTKNKLYHSLYQEANLIGQLLHFCNYATIVFLTNVYKKKTQKGKYQLECGGVVVPSVYVLLSLDK